jgi:hypothetical protein
MNTNPLKNTLLGDWAGQNLLNLSWLPNPEHLSDTTLQVKNLVNDNFVQFTYTWSHESTPHTGTLLLGVDPETRNRRVVRFVASKYRFVALSGCGGGIRKNRRARLVSRAHRTRLGLAHRA